MEPLLRVLCVGLFARGFLGLVEAALVAGGEPGALQLPGTLGGVVGGPFWPAVWGAGAMAAGVGLGRGSRNAWLLGVAASLAYLLDGIADLDTFPIGSLSPERLAASAIAELVIPAMLLAGLLLVARVVGDPRAAGLGPR